MSINAQRLGADNRINAFSIQGNYGSMVSGGTPTNFVLLQPPQVQMTGTVEQQHVFGQQTANNLEPNRNQETGIRRVEGQFVAPMDVFAHTVWFNAMFGEAVFGTESEAPYTRTWDADNNLPRLLTVISQYDADKFSFFRSLTTTRMVIPIAPDQGASVQRIEVTAQAAAQTWGDGTAADAIMTGVSTPATVGYNPILAGNVSVVWGATNPNSLQHVLSGSIEISNGVEHVPVANGSGTAPGAAFQGIVTAMARLRIRVVDNDQLFTDSTAGTERNLVVTWTGVDSNNVAASIAFTLRNCRVTPVGPRAEGPGGVEQEFTFMARQSTSASAFAIVSSNASDPTP